MAVNLHYFSHEIPTLKKLTTEIVMQPRDIFRVSTYWTSYHIFIFFLAKVAWKYEYCNTETKSIFLFNYWISFMTINLHHFPYDGLALKILKKHYIRQSHDIKEAFWFSTGSLRKTIKTKNGGSARYSIFLLG